MLWHIRSPRMLALLIGCGVVFAGMLLIPHPGLQQIRDWAHSVGPLLPIVFFLVHTLVCIAPFPRTVFTVSAGLLFGPLPGIALALAATTASAWLAMLFVRTLGREKVVAHLTHPAVWVIDRRLERRGWLAVGALRLIAPVPFSVVNYCAGLSSVRTVPYVLATLIGTVPGTVGVVVLGDTLTDRANPALLALSGAYITLGIVGLVVDARLGVPDIEPADTTSA